jgi:hypothetical protein
MNRFGDEGQIVVRLLIAVFTLTLIGGSIYYVLQNYQQNQQVYHRKALSISEYGLMMAFEELGKSPSWSKGFGKTDYDGGWYLVKMERITNNDTLFLSITSEGHLKSAAEIVKCILSLNVADGDSVWTRRSMQ